MTDGTVPNYPDILGYITGERYNIGVAQVALAVRPRVVRAGRPFEVIMLIQNASDVDVDLTVNLHIPDRDAAKKKGRFVAKVDRLVVGIQPAEVGYVVLPMSCLPDTAPSPDYKVGMEINVKALGKPQRIRPVDGGGKVELDHLKPDISAKIEELKQLTFSASKRSGLRATVLEAGFSVMSGRVGAIVDLQPGWMSLWTLQDHLDDRVLLQRYHETIKVKVLPALNPDAIFKPLLDETNKRFEAAGYSLKPIEANFIAKLLTLIITYSLPDQSPTHSLVAGIYNVQPLLTADRLKDETPILLPRWMSAFLRALVRDERAARYPVLALTQLAYKDLLTDAMTHALEMIETSTGEDLGTPDERVEYVRQILDMLDAKGKLDLTHVYMPLVMGGIIAYDRVILPDEKLGELLQGIRTILEERRSEMTDDNEPIFHMAERLIDQALMKYGYRNK